ncbi:ABC transporter permease [Actinokineospora pegani]|uniref:ABC transporter permease n=1 Tax=Actinokineospora pegani TaxID=2654637 RepID=UPI0012EA31BC|nr:ABC transporter permease [Actinokineospora pegani]
MPPEALPAREQLLDLVLIQFSNLRWAWTSMVLTGVLMPVLMTLSFGAMADRGSDDVTAVLCGSVVLSLMFQNQNNVASNFAYMKAMGTLDFLATLPVRRHLLVVATVAAFFALSLPSVVVTAALGALVLGVPLSLSPWAVLVLPLCALPLAGIGAIVGITARTPEAAGSVSVLVSLVLVFLGPVLIPASRLPGWVLATSHLSPATYAASAVRQVLAGPVTARLALDLAVLAGVCALSLWWVGARLPWRQG